MSPEFNVKTQSTGKVRQAELPSQDRMRVPQNLTEPSGWRKGSRGRGIRSFHAQECQERHSKEEVDILRLLFRGLRVINRNNSNINMIEKNWEEKGGQVANAITRTGSQERLFPGISQVIEYETMINIIN